MPARSQRPSVIGSTTEVKFTWRDVAEAIDSHKEQESFARLDKKNDHT